MTFDDCLEKGLIRRAADAKSRVKQSLLIADKFLKSAEKNLDIGENEVCEIIAYNALFHYARALLFNKGYLERSHACLFLALERLYPEYKELLERADKIRMERHNLQYGGMMAEGEAPTFVLEFVREFANCVKKTLAF